MSVQNFKNQIFEGLEKIIERNKWKMDSQQHQGYAFQVLFAEYASNLDSGLECDIPEDAVSKSKDLGVDVVLEDPVRRYLLIAQCKYRKPKDPFSSADQNELSAFLDSHTKICDEDFVRKYASDHVQSLLEDYKDKVNKDGYSVKYCFVSTAKANSKCFDLVEQKNQHYQEQGVNITCELLDFDKFKEWYSNKDQLEEKVPVEVEITLAIKRFMSMDDWEHKTIIAVIKGTALVDLYKRYPGLLTYNIRDYLGTRGEINKTIKETAQERGKEFFFFNNGISAICTSYELDGNHLVAHNFQIINGAQTVGALKQAGSKLDSSVEVLFRLIQADKVSTTTAGFNADIIKYNNTQNVVKLSDFRSNDKIQIWLENKFKQRETSAKLLPKINYVRTRSSKRAPSGEKSLKLEDLAKIRYAYLQEPVLIHESPRDLWTREKDDANGKYHLAFGLYEEAEAKFVEVDSWADNFFYETLFSILAKQKIEESMRKHKEEKGQYPFPISLQYHALSLVGAWIRANISKILSFKELINNQNKFEDLWKNAWPIVHNEIVREYKRTKSTRVLQRNQKIWESMKSCVEDFMPVS